MLRINISGHALLATLLRAIYSILLGYYYCLSCHVVRVSTTAVVGKRHSCECVVGPFIRVTYYAFWPDVEAIVIYREGTPKGEFAKSQIRTVWFALLNIASVYSITVMHTYIVITVSSS